MVSVSMVLRVLSWFKSFTSRSRRIFTKAANISTIATHSRPPALRWFWSEILRALATGVQLKPVKIRQKENPGNGYGHWPAP